MYSSGGTDQSGYGGSEPDNTNGYGYGYDGSGYDNANGYGYGYDGSGYDNAGGYGYGYNGGGYGPAGGNGRYAPRQSGLSTAAWVCIAVSAAVILGAVLAIVFRDSLRQRLGGNNAAPVPTTVAVPTAAPTALPAVVPTVPAVSTPTPAPTPTPKPTPIPTATPTPKPTDPPVRPGSPSWADLRSEEGWIEPPLYSSSWRSDYRKVRYVQAPSGVSIYLLPRPEKSEDYRTINDDVRVTVLAEENNFSLVKAENGQIGWVTSSMLVTNDERISRIPPLSSTYWTYYDGKNFYDCKIINGVLCGYNRTDSADYLEEDVKTSGRRLVVCYSKKNLHLIWDGTSFASKDGKCTLEYDPWGQYDQH